MGLRQLHLCFESDSSWKSMKDAPKDATRVLLKLPMGEEIVGHWACDMSGEEQPPFRGWFKKSDNGKYYVQIQPGPIAWKPKRE